MDYTHTLHGLITIRLVDAPAAAVQDLEYLLGPSTGTPAAEPDIRVRFTADAAPRDGLRYLGLHEAAFDETGFYTLDDEGRAAAFDFARLGEPLEVACASAGALFPYLLPVIGLRLLAKGCVMLHAASFVWEDTGVLVTGWQKGGKTEMLLAYMAQGAQYLADEWTIVSPADGMMYGIAGTLQIWDWHLRYLPQYWDRLRTGERSRLRMLRAYQRGYRLLPERWHGRGPGGKWFQRLSLDGGVSLVGQARTAPARIFGDRVWQGGAPIDVVFLAGVGQAIGVAPVAPGDVADRMIASLAFERGGLLARYDQYRYAFPGRRSSLLDGASEREREALARTLAGRPAYEIVHPYPVPLPALHSATAAAVRAARPAGRALAESGAVK